MPPRDAFGERAKVRSDVVRIGSDGGDEVTTATRDEVLSRVRDVLVDALGVDSEEVTPEATLQGDLGAESIDFLDIVFRLEKAFGIKVNRSELFPEEVLSNPDYVDNGKMTEEGISKLRSAMPHADLSDFEKDPQVERIRDLFTVDAIVNYVEQKLRAA